MTKKVIKEEVPKEAKTPKKKKLIKDTKFYKNICKKIKNANLSKTKFNTLEMILIMIITIVFGIFVGYSVNFKKSPAAVTLKATELDKVYNTILENYYDNVDKDKLLEAAVSGMMSYLEDDYSSYISAADTAAFEEKLEGTYYGIGAELTYNEQGTYVYSVFENSPAAKAGLKVNDVIIEVNGTDVKGKYPADISSLIKGNNKLEVKMKVLRDNKEIELSLVTESVNIPSVSSEVITNGTKKTGYIGLSIFAANTSSQFKTELEKLEKQNIDNLIIDVRSNLGGHLNVVREILEMLLPKDSPLYQIKSKDKVEITTDKTAERRTYPIAVLTNEVSASASEILSAAMKEIYGSEIVGEKTFGKGTVQTTMNLSTGGMVKYTIQTWLSAKGNKINKVGVEPTIQVSLDEEYAKNPTKENDKQLQKALETLK